MRLINPDVGGWVAQSEDFPVAAHGGTVDKAASNLIDALRRFLNAPQSPGATGQDICDADNCKKPAIMAGGCEDHPPF